MAGGHLGGPRVVPAGAVSMGIPVTLAPGSEDGVTLAQVPAGPVDDAEHDRTGQGGTHGGAGRRRSDDGGLWQATPA